MEAIQGRAITLRGLLKSDERALYRYATDPQVARYRALDSPLEQHEFAASLHHRIAEVAGERNFVIAGRGSDAPLGMIRLQFTAPGHADVTFWLGRPHWSRGYAYEAVGLLCIHGFVQWALELIEARCYAGNVRCITLLDRLGFQSVQARKLKSSDLLLGRELLFRLALADFTFKRAS